MTADLAAGPIPDASAPSEDVDAAAVNLELNNITKFPWTPENTLLLFDWDDTILPTTFLQQHGYRLDGPTPPDVVLENLGKLARDVSQTLVDARKWGKVIIVTNAETGWVEMTTSKFFAQVSEAIEGVEVVSARSVYEPEGVTNPFEWKMKAFTHLIEKFAEEQGTAGGKLNVISLGDSSHEREAILHVTNMMSNVVTKSLKLMERPDIWHMHHEHKILRSCLECIVRHDGLLDLCIQVNEQRSEEENEDAPMEEGAEEPKDGDAAPVPEGAALGA